jgi:HEAT repeat protein
MTKAVLRALLLVVPSVLIALLIEGVKDWRVHSNLSPKRFVLIGLAVFILCNLLLYLLEKPRALPLTWRWHRIQYAHDLSTYLERRWRYQLPSPKRLIPIVDVLSNGSRTDLGSYLLSAVHVHGTDRLRILVLGERGAGKSVAMENLAWELAHSCRWWWSHTPIPVLCRMGRFSEGTVEAFAASEIASITKGSSGAVLSAGLTRLLQRKRAILLLDAVDETPDGQRSRVFGALEDLAKPSRGDAPVIMTSRIRDPLVASLSREAGQVLQIQDLSDKGVDHLIESYILGPADQEHLKLIRSRLDSHDLLGAGGLARNPFWLLLILRGGAFEKRRAQIIDAASKQLLRDELSKAPPGRPWARLPDPEGQIHHTIRRLEDIAYRMTSDGLNAEPFDDLASAHSAGRSVQKKQGSHYRHHLAAESDESLKASKLTPNDELQLSRDALLIDFAFSGPGARPPEVRFRHPLLQHFFAGSALYSTPDLFNPSILKSIPRDNRWWDALVVLNELFDTEINLRFDRHSALVRSVLGDKANGRRVIFAAGLLWPVDKLLDQDLVNEIGADLLARCVKSHADPDLLSGARSLFAVAPELFVNAVELIAEKRDRDTQPATLTLLREVIGQYVESPAAGRALKSLLNSSILGEQVKKVLVELGEAAVEPVVAALDSRPPHIVIELLGDLQSPKSVDRLLELLDRSQDDFEKANIAVALGKIKDERAIPLLSALAHENTLWVHSPAIEALGRIGAVAPLIELFDLGGLQSFAAVDALVEIGRDAVPLLVEALEHQNPEVRAGALEALGKIGDESSASSIAACLRDTDGLVILRAVEALGSTGPAGIEPLLHLVEGYGQQNAITSRAAECLSKLGRAAVQALLEATHHANGVMRAVAAEALGEIRDTAAFDRLREMLSNDSEAYVRYNAGKALGNLGDPRAILPLQRVRQLDRYLLAQIGATVALAKLQVPGSINWLLDRLEKGFDGISPKENASLQFIVGKALTELREKRALRGLEQLAKNPDYADSCRHFIDQLVTPPSAKARASDRGG